MSAECWPRKRPATLPVLERVQEIPRRGIAYAAKPRATELERMAMAVQGRCDHALQSRDSANSQTICGASA